MIERLPEGEFKVKQVKNRKQGWLQTMGTEDKRFSLKARENLACCKNSVAQASEHKMQSTDHEACQV